MNGAQLQKIVQEVLIVQCVERKKINNIKLIDVKGVIDNGA